MIEKSLKTTKGKLLVKIPTYMSEVTLGQVIAMQKKQYLNDLDAISILSGIPMDELHRVTNVQDFQVFGESVLSLSHQIKYLYNSHAIPYRVTFTFGEKISPRFWSTPLKAWSRVGFSEIYQPPHFLSIIGRISSVSVSDEYWAF